MMISSDYSGLQLSLLFCSLFGGLISCGPTQSLETVEEVQLDRYTGKWYEIASLPASFQKNCSCTTAEYEDKGDYIKVYNRCFDMEKKKWKDASAKAFPVEGSGNSRLKVQFFWPFKGDYYIIALDEAYRYALVGTPSRKYLWILSRRPDLDDAVYQKLVERAAELDFPVEQLQQTTQDCKGE